MRLPLVWLFAVVTLTGNRFIMSSYAVADRPPTHRWLCAPDCVCLAGGGDDDITRSRGGELCVRSAEVGLLSASRLASVTHLSISGPPSSTLFAAAHRLSNVRRLQIVFDDDADVADWMRLFTAFSRLNELTIRNSSAAAAAATALFTGRFLPNLRSLDVSGTDASAVESLQRLRDLEVLDVSGNSLRQLTAVNDTASIDYDKDDVACGFSSSIRPSSSQLLVGRYGFSNISRR